MPWQLNQRETQRVREREGKRCFVCNGIHIYILGLLTLMTLKPKLRFASTPAMRLLPNILSNASSISIFCKKKIYSVEDVVSGRLFKKNVKEKQVRLFRA